MKPVVSLDSQLVARRDLKNGYFALQFSPFPRLKSIKPGQFVHVGLYNANLFYRRAFSVSAVSHESGTVEILFKTIGRGTRALETLRLGDKVNLLGPLGRAFSVPAKGRTAVIVAGGVGVPPLLFFAETLINRGWDKRKIVFYYGGRSTGDIVERQRIKKLGFTFHPVTEDGTFGEKGLVTTPLKQELKDKTYANPFLYACGPEPMLKAVDKLAEEFQIPGELSLEAPMPCGFGICLGCVVPLKAGGFARVCQEGPVFSAGAVAL